MTDMLTFPKVEQDYPQKRVAGERSADFAEISRAFALAKAEEQSSRCSQCGVPYCSTHCPLHNHIPDWLRLTAEGRLREAYELSNATSTMPEICGRICPQDRLCEGNCVIEFSGHGAVTIGSVEKFITDTAWEEGWVEPLVPGPAKGQSVGVIGAGPAGLTVADLMRARGYDVHVYDRHDRMGGLLTYGIPGFKLEKHVVMRRVDRLRDGGVVFHEEFEVGRDATLDELRQRHDAIVIATGVYKPRAIRAPGVGATGVVEALDYLTASNRKGFGDVVPAYDGGALNAFGKHVVVVGGGDTAMDCVRTARRQGAASVRCLYRRDRANMPGSQREVRNAEEEGVEFVWLAAPEAFHDEDGRVAGVQVTRMRLGEPDASGRRAPEVDPGAGERIAADLVIKALGFDPEELPRLFGAPDLSVTRWGTVRVDHKTMMTSLEGVFAAGDIVRGASLVVWAVRDGRDLSERMHAWLRVRAKTARGGGVIVALMVAAALLSVDGQPLPIQRPGAAPGMEVWQVDQLRLAPNTPPATLAALGPDHSMAAVVKRLTALGVPFTRARVGMLPDSMPAKMREQIARAPAGEPFLLPGRDYISVNVIVGRRLPPNTVRLEPASPRAAPVLEA